MSTRRTARTVVATALSALVVSSVSLHVDVAAAAAAAISPVDSSTTTTVTAPSTTASTGQSTTTTKPPAPPTGLPRLPSGAASTTATTTPPVPPTTTSAPPGLIGPSAGQFGAVAPDAATAVPAAAAEASQLPSRGTDTAPSAARNGLKQLLDASLAARRQLDTQVAEAEAAVAQRESDLAAARSALAGTEAEMERLRAAVVDATAVLARAEKALPILSAAEAAAAAATKQRTTPVGYPPAPGHTVKDEAKRAGMALAVGRRARDDAVLALGDARVAVEQGEQGLSEARRTVTGLAEEIEQRRNSLTSLRQQLAAAVASGTTGIAWVANALTTEGSAAAKPSAFALSDIPADYLALYVRQAVSCPGLSWTVLAAIGSVESGHGRSNDAGVHTGANSAGAMGPMQFLGPTWAAYGADGNGDGTRDVYEPADAIAGAANYLCANGAGQLARLAGAIWDYNHADWYVASVIELATAYGDGGIEAPAAPVDAARLVDDPNLTLSPAARSDILGGLADRRVVDLLAAVVAHHRISVSVVKTGHDMHVHNTDRISNHYACEGCPGRALDITAVDGVEVTSSNAAALSLALSILTTNPPLRPDEFGSPWPDLARLPGGFSDDDHRDHLHIGWSRQATP